MFITEQTRIMNLSYTPSTPITELWDELEDLQDLSNRANHNLPDTSLISIAWSILNQCGIYGKDLNEWDRLPLANRTWNGMKMFFNRVHKEYKAVNQGTTVSESSLNHTTEVLSRRFDKIEKALLLQKETNHDTENAYAIVNRVSILESKIHEIQSALEELLQIIKTVVSNERRSKRRENPHGTHYCWTHGWVNHKGSECSNKKTGHQDNATLTNPMGGSTNGVSRSLLNNE